MLPSLFAAHRGAIDSRLAWQIAGCLLCRGHQWDIWTSLINDVRDEAAPHLEAYAPHIIAHMIDTDIGHQAAAHDRV